MLVPENRLVLFLSKQCEACQRTIELSREVQGVDFDFNWVTPSRVGGMYQMMPAATDLYPKLIRKQDLPAVPALYDPLLDEMFVGLEAIESYFRMSGLLSDD